MLEVLVIVILAVMLLIGLGACKVAGRSNKVCDDIERKEYQKRLDTKGGEK